MYTHLLQISNIQKLSLLPPSHARSVFPNFRIFEFSDFPTSARMKHESALHTHVRVHQHPYLAQYSNFRIFGNWLCCPLGLRGHRLRHPCMVRRKEELALIADYRKTHRVSCDNKFHAGCLRPDCTGNWQDDPFMPTGSAKRMDGVGPRSDATDSPNAHMMPASVTSTVSVTSVASGIGEIWVRAVNHV